MRRTRHDHPNQANVALLLKEREVIYRVPSVQQAVDLILELDNYSQEELVGLAVLVRGYEGRPEEFFVLANARLTSGRFSAMEANMAQFGNRTDFKYEDLIRMEPHPHFMSSGLASQILPMMKTQWPEIRTK